MYVTVMFDYWNCIQALDTWYYWADVQILCRFYPNSDALLHLLSLPVSCLRCAVSSVASLVCAKALYQTAQKAFLSFSMGASAVRCVRGSRVRPAVSCFRVTFSAACNVTIAPASLETQESVSVSFNHQIHSIATIKHGYYHKPRP